MHTQDRRTWCKYSIEPSSSQLDQITQSQCGNGIFRHFSHSKEHDVNIQWNYPPITFKVFSWIKLQKASIYVSPPPPPPPAPQKKKKKKKKKKFETINRDNSGLCVLGWSESTRFPFLSSYGCEQTPMIITELRESCVKARLSLLTRKEYHEGISWWHTHHLSTWLRTRCRFKPFRSNQQMLCEFWYVD